MANQSKNSANQTPTLISPKATPYNGQLFRSRLEAHWAAMFDILGLRWYYEPDQYEYFLGNWVPDFLIDINGSGIAVEVKPWASPPKDVADKITTVCKQVLYLGNNQECVWEVKRGTVKKLAWLVHENKAHLNYACEKTNAQKGRFKTYWHKAYSEVMFYKPEVSMKDQAKYIASRLTQDQLEDLISELSKQNSGKISKLGIWI